MNMLDGLIRSGLQPCPVTRAWYKDRAVWPPWPPYPPLMVYTDTLNPHHRLYHLYPMYPHQQLYQLYLDDHTTRLRIFLPKCLRSHKGRLDEDEMVWGNFLKSMHEPECVQCPLLCHGVAGGGWRRVRDLMRRLADCFLHFLSVILISTLCVYTVYTAPQSTRAWNKPSRSCDNHSKGPL